MAKYVWTVKVINECNPSHVRDINMVSSAEFRVAMNDAVTLVSKKWPNEFKDSCPDSLWHPDMSIVGLLRGLELDDGQEEPP